MSITTEELERVTEQNNHIYSKARAKIYHPEILHDVTSFCDPDWHQAGVVDQLIIEYEPSDYYIIVSKGYEFLIVGSTKEVIFFKCPKGFIVACKADLNEVEKSILVQCYHMGTKKYETAMPASVYRYVKEAADILCAALRSARRCRDRV